MLIAEKLFKMFSEDFLGTLLGMEKRVFDLLEKDGGSITFKTRQKSVDNGLYFRRAYLDEDGGVTIETSDRKKKNFEKLDWINLSLTDKLNLARIVMSDRKNP